MMYISTNKLTRTSGLSINSSFNFNRKLSVSPVLRVESESSGNESEEVSNPGVPSEAFSNNSSVAFSSHVGRSSPFSKRESPSAAHYNRENSSSAGSNSENPPIVGSPSGYSDMSHESKNEYVAMSKSYPGELVEAFWKNPMGLVYEINTRLKTLREFGKAAILDLVWERLDARSDISKRELQNYDDKTGNLVDVNHHKIEAAADKLNKAGHDALDTIYSYHTNDKKAQSLIKDIVESQNNRDKSGKRGQEEFKEDVLKSLPGDQLDEYSESEASEEREVRDNNLLSPSPTPSPAPSSPSPSVLEALFSRWNSGFSSSGVAGPSSNVTAEASNKRKADEAELDSPLDFVLKKQELEPFDPTDDID
jgi:hypothetical protein